MNIRNACMIRDPHVHAPANPIPHAAAPYRPPKSSPPVRSRPYSNRRIRDNAFKIKISMIRRPIQLEHFRLTTHALGALPDYFLVDFTTAPIAMLQSSIGEWVSWI